MSFGNGLLLRLARAGNAYVPTPQTPMQHPHRRHQQAPNANRTGNTAEQKKKKKSANVFSVISFRYQEERN
jgi:hypothetical protein